MIISSGILITKGNEILLGQATRNRWDIPKGQMEPGEDPKETAIRECEEEFGITAPYHDLEDLGEFKYMSGKKLHLFRWEVDQFPDLNTLHCSSYYERNGKQYPEIFAYQIFSFDDALEKVGKNMKRVLGKVFEQSILKEAFFEARQ